MYHNYKMAKKKIYGEQLEKIHDGVRVWKVMFISSLHFVKVHVRVNL